MQHPNIVQIYEIGEHDGLPYLLAGVRGRRHPRGAGSTGKPQPPREAAALVGNAGPGDAVRPRARHRPPRPEAGQHPLGRKGLPGRQPTGRGHRVAVAVTLACRRRCPRSPTSAWPSSSTRRHAAQTQAGTILGTPSYMAPEQAARRRQRRRPAARRLRPRRDPLRAAHRPAAVPGRDVARHARPGADQRAGAADAAAAEGAARPGNDLPEVPAKGAGEALRLGRRAGRRPGPLPAAASRSRPGRSSARERAWRWCRRNPVVAGLSAVAAVLAVCVVIGSVTAAVSLSAKNKTIETEKNIAIQAMRDAEAAREKADQNEKVAASQAEVALGAMQTLVDQVQTQLDEIPGTEQLKENLLNLVVRETVKIDKAAEKSTSIEPTRGAGTPTARRPLQEIGKEQGGNGKVPSPCTTSSK